MFVCLQGRIQGGFGGLDPRVIKGVQKKKKKEKGKERERKGKKEVKKGKKREKINQHDE